MRRKDRVVPQQKQKPHNTMRGKMASKSYNGFGFEGSTPRFGQKGWIPEDPAHRARRNSRVIEII